MELNLDRILAIVGIVLAIILVVLDKAGKLKGPLLLVLLGLAAFMTLPLALGSSWIKDTAWGMLKFSKTALMVSLVAVCYSACAIWISQPNETEGKGLIQGAPLTIQMEEIKDLDQFFVRNDELELAKQFGFVAMKERNILMVRDRIIAFRKTGDKYNFDVTPYQFKGGEVLLETSELKTNRISQGGVGVGPLPADRVFLIMLPSEYVEGRRKLSQYEKSPELPTAIVTAVKDFDLAVERNASILRGVLDDALKENPDNFLFHDDAGSAYWLRIDALYREKFILLSPKADAVRTAIRQFLGVN